MQYLLVKFASICGATVTKFWKPNVTHVVAATDAKGACSRSFKVLKAILHGRWILKTDCEPYNLFPCVFHFDMKMLYRCCILWYNIMVNLVLFFVYRNKLLIHDHLVSAGLQG